jgi:hypothetical protein
LFESLDEASHCVLLGGGTACLQSRIAATGHLHRQRAATSGRVVVTARRQDHCADGQNTQRGAKSLDFQSNSFKWNDVTIDAGVAPVRQTALLLAAMRHRNKARRPAIAPSHRRICDFSCSFRVVYGPDGGLPVGDRRGDELSDGFRRGERVRGATETADFTTLSHAN